MGRPLEGMVGDRSATPPLPAGVVTFVMTDIEGSTRLFRELGERYVELLATHQALLRGPCTTHGGVEVGTEGDALFFAFDDAAEAVAACLEGQRALSAHPGQQESSCACESGCTPVRPTGPETTTSTSPCIRQPGSVPGHTVARWCSRRPRRPPSRVGCLSERRFSRSDRSSCAGSESLERLFQLDHPDIRRRFPPLRLIGVVRHNLPLARAGFVGRTEERTALGSLLRTEGVVSVVGMGGVGKTRLAIQVAFDVMDRFPDGAWMVELAALSEPASVPRAVAEATRVTEMPGRSIDEVLIEALADREALLVLDNCEHLLDAVADLAERLSRHCPHLVILATSREPLDIEGEVVWRMSALPVEEPDGVDSAAEVADVDSVRLFVERARSVNPAVRAHRRQRRRCRPHRGPV